ncbi:MAG: mycofactocin biosynthesis glycosyltransferase MftF [Actinobacteria bacterium]|nr:mycofactocin biosynthesis glycosyltransferase MftF [Actinomycetota bacterium]
MRIVDGGRVLIGGSPLTVLRFAAPIDLDDITSASVVDRLLDCGMAHPVIGTAPFDPTEVSIVVPVFDDVAGLAETLAGIRRAGTTGTAIVVVDDGSTEPDAIAATVALAGNPMIRLIRNETNRGPGGARNAGLELVDTPLVAFLDAGCVPEPGWLDALLPHFGDDRVALVAPRVHAEVSRTVEYRQESSPFGRRVAAAIRAYEARRSSLDLGDEPARVAPGTRVAYVPTACVVARTDEIRRIGGFDERLELGEDVDLVWRLAEDRRLRYEPAARVGHDIRSHPRAWLRRKFDYGTSAAPLALRHPAGPVPVRISRWSAAAWIAVAAGRPLAGTAVAAVSTALLIRKLALLDHPVAESVRLAGVGNVAAGALLANAVRRAWWPVALPFALVGPRPLRRTIVAAFLVPPILTWRPGSGVDPATWAVLSIADDLAYGAGVWSGCIRFRTVAPLVPDLSVGRVTAPR